MRKKTKWPKVSFILLTLNGGEGVRKCIESLGEQDYPKEKIELIVVDNGSIDNSVDIAKELGAKVFLEPEGTLYSNWIVGLHKVTGEYTFYLEQDIVLRTKNFIKLMVKPMLEDKRLIATLTTELPKKNMNWVNRFLSYHYSQCDPLLEFLFDKLENKIIEKNKKCKVCKFDEKLQPACRMFYRIEYLKKTPNWRAKNYFDHDFVINCVRSGFPYFGYVPEAGYYHYHVQGLKHFLRKRIRNMHMHYFDYYDKSDYVTFDIKDRIQVIKLMGFLIYANSLIFPAIRGFIRFLKYKDWVLLTEPIITIGVTDVLLLAFVKDKRGRRFIARSLKTALHI